MGTPSLTRIFADSEQICSLYGQFDGYLHGHGLRLANYLAEFDVVYGLPMSVPEKVANGPYCLAAQIIAHFKTEPGGHYLYPPIDDVGNERFEYDVQCNDDNNISISYYYHGDRKFSGTPQEFIQFINQQED